MTEPDEVEERARALAAALSERLSLGFEDDTAADLALLQIMPFEEDAVPLDLTEKILARNPQHGLAALVRSYLSLHYLMDDQDLQRSAVRLETLIAHGIEVAASYLQLAAIRRAFDVASTFADTIDLTRAAIDSEPGWTLGHLNMARALRELGRPEDARLEYNAAIGARIPDHAYLKPLEWSYAACFTGQVMSRDYIEQERDELSTELQ